MNKKLKHVIFSIDDTILGFNNEKNEMFAEVTKLINFLKRKNIGFSILANRTRPVSVKGKTEKVDLFDALKQHWGDFPVFCSGIDASVPYKPQAKAVKYVIDKLGLEENEVVLLGAKLDDMRTALNGGVLFLRATWYTARTDYGLEFSTPKDVAKFIDIFCTREHYWCFQINEQGFRYYALAPFSTYKAEYTTYSEDARSTAKHGTGHPEFWVSALITSIYFTGLHREVDYICSYPGHKRGYGNKVMNEPMKIFGRCFNKNYIPDLIYRHTDAPKSQTARREGRTTSHENQLNTIHIQMNPIKKIETEKRYASPPTRRGKTVLVLDDFCTRGYSLEAARQYIHKTGSKTILVSWLKTINTDIEKLFDIDGLKPYSANQVNSPKVDKIFNYHTYLTDPTASEELTELFQRFQEWDKLD